MEPLTLVTGASGGLGTRMASHLLSSQQGRGRRFVFQYRTKPQPIKKIVEAHGGDPENMCFSADLRHATEVKTLRERIVETHGPVSAVVNLHGASSNAVSWKMSVDQFKDIVDANLLSTFLVCREFIPDMRSAGWGRLINVSSVVGFTGIAGASHYAAAKAGVVGLTKSIALEVASKGVTANAIALGYFSAGLIEGVPPEIQDAVRSRIPLGRFGDPAEFASLVDYLLDDAAGYFTGQVIHLNGGLYG